eukprot:13304641-Heterocapsa_arctica.AAC.1
MSGNYQREGEDEEGEGAEQLRVKEVDLRQVVDSLRLIIRCCPWSWLKGTNVNNTNMDFKQEVFLFVSALSQAAKKYWRGDAGELQVEERPTEAQT